jgi:hypothetical protein
MEMVIWEETPLADEEYIFTKSSLISGFGVSRTAG